MSSADIRQISIQGHSRDADRLFKAAVGAFSALTRPGRLEIEQLDDLTGPLFNSTSDETRRFASAALSDCQRPPSQLLARLCREPIETAAPILVRSPAISDVELIAVIGTHGLPHARAIARRTGLNRAIIDLLRLFGDADIDRLLGHRMSAAAAGLATKPTDVESPAELVRQRLRGMMLAASDIPAVSRQWFGPDQTTAPAASRRLFELALLPDRKIFLEALASVLGLHSAQTASLTRPRALWDFMVALRSLFVPGTTAFAIVELICAESPHGADQTRLFFRRYDGIRPDIARERVIRWRGNDRSSDTVDNHQLVANDDHEQLPDVSKNLRAS